MTTLKIRQEQVNIITFAITFNKARDRRRLFPKGALKVVGKILKEVSKHPDEKKLDQICEVSLDKEMRGVIQFCLDDHDWLPADADPLEDLEEKLRTVK